MPNIPTKLKIELSELLLQWYRQFGKVAPRRPYYDEEGDDSGAGGAELLFESHPLFADLPIGAPSDLDFIIQTNNQNIAEADKRADEACPELKYQIELALAQKYRTRPAPIAKPSPL
jgi:hypothetical protein